jgi:hypothetical protein
MFKIALIHDRPHHCWSVDELRKLQMKTWLLLAVALLQGCTSVTSGHLYPVHGSLAAMSPVPAYKVSLSGAPESGTMSATLPNGEVCKGSWGPVERNDPTAGLMSGEWDSVYGSGFFSMHLLGKRAFARALLLCPKGSVLHIEFYDPTAGKAADINGIASDDQGNVFKLAF